MVRKQLVKKQSVFLCTVLALSGCATYTGWTPVVDTYNNPNAYRLQQDLEECKMLAREAASTGTEALKGGAAGALLGAATGAAVGAVAGNPGGGAAIGAAAGGLGGAGYSGVSGDDLYKRAYINCLRNRGHKVIN
ncbi:glycine zipper family protein [Methylocaldum szegediense]|uniref:OmpA family protein n=1 Tax=Methylocaldum szegediense TaxID=73780 RepID=A0ABM9HYW0_9GAMM|nr:glycine zipper family protein [Methylocaldum szegediense]CAI8777617.1 OmpA family protein [Methylocaldum szegediense]